MAASTLNPETPRASAVDDRSPCLTSPDTHRRADTASPIRREDPALRSELDSEILWAIGAGYAAGIVGAEEPACTHPVSDKGFKDIVAGFNRAMADIHARFPGVRRIEPPKLSRQDPFRTPGNPCDARYQPETRGLCFREFADFSSWEQAASGFGAGQLAPANGFAGVVARQLGHHLSSASVVHPMVWAPPLRLTLDANYHLADSGEGMLWKLDSERPFPPWVGKLARRALTDSRLEKALGEFAAGAIAWRLHPDYGRTPSVPRLPGYLAGWLHESFPFLDNGQPPDTCVQGESSQQGAGRLPSSTGRPGTHTRPVAERSFPEPPEDAPCRPPAHAKPAGSIVSAALETEAQWGMVNGYVKGILDKDHPLCTHPVSDYGFWQILLGFNRAMSDFHARFPGLRDTAPPFLLRNDPSLSWAPEMNGCHLPHLRALCFREFADLATSYGTRDFDGTRDMAPQKGFGGAIAHEYGHHLSSDAVVPPAVWQPKLEGALRVNRIWSPENGPRTLGYSDDRAFPIQVGRRARKLGIGWYAGSSPTEFAAEAIAWRLHPDYAASPAAPRMPRFLEDWVHENFPFLDNGQIPEPSCEVDPDAVTAPVFRNGSVHWIPQGKLRAVKGPAEVHPQVKPADAVPAGRGYSK